MEDKKVFEISEELANKILNYMASKPFAEVYVLITELQNEVKQSITPKQDNIVDINA